MITWITWERQIRGAGWRDSVWENQAGSGPVAAGWRRKMIKRLNKNEGDLRKNERNSEDGSGSVGDTLEMWKPEKNERGLNFFEDMLEICRRYVEEYTIRYRKYFEDMLEIRWRSENLRRMRWGLDVCWGIFVEDTLKIFRKYLKIC